MLYILCVVPVILFGQMGLPTLGICTMFLMIAAATGLLILQGKDDKADDERESRSPKSELDKSIDTLVGVVGVIVYLAVSFATSAWYITWVIFPIMAAVKGLIRAILDLKEATK